MANNNFETVTELTNSEVSKEQIFRAYSRYNWASKICRDKDVLEVACGGGMGLGMLFNQAKNLVAGDFTYSIARIAKNHYKDRMPIMVFDAQSLPFKENSFDVILIVEAIYYISDVDKFFDECKRVLRSKGKLLIVTANKDLYDFNPSPYSNSYFGVKEFADLFHLLQFKVKFYGDVKINSVSFRQRILRPLKWLAVRFNLIPGSMHGKRILKRLVFGSPEKMPPELLTKSHYNEKPTAIIDKKPNREFKTLFIEATMMS